MQVHRSMKLTLVVVVWLLVSQISLASEAWTVFLDGKEMIGNVDVESLEELGPEWEPLVGILETLGGNVHWDANAGIVAVESPYSRFLAEFLDHEGYMKSAEDVLFMKHIDEVILVDVRSKDLRQRSLISESIHIPLPELLNRLQELPADRVLAVYCTSNTTAAYAVAILNMLGYEAYVLQNGINAWITAGGRATFISN